MSRHSGHSKNAGGLYTTDQRARRDATIWTPIQGILAPLQFIAFAVSLVLVIRFLLTDLGYEAATWSILIKTAFLYVIMITGAIWEKVVFGQYLFADAFFWEDVFSFGVIGLHTPLMSSMQASSFSNYALHGCKPQASRQKGSRHERSAHHRLRQHADSKATRPTRGLLRPDGNHLAAPQNAGCLLFGDRQSHLCAPFAVRRWRDDLCRTALWHGDP